MSESNQDRPRNLNSPNASAQLVFGIIALQNGFITREQLVAAFDAWVRDKSRDLAGLLLEQGALSQARHDSLVQLVVLFLEMHQGDAEQSLAKLSSVAEVRPQLEGLHDPDLAVSLGHVGRERPSDEDSESTILTTGDASHGRFRILRPHAKGGLGQVSVALDQELNREVALKEIQPRHADDPTSRERFILEAEITGGLEHPGIVPVYALGQAADGRPFYAMRFVKGDSLKTAIEAYHKPDNPNRQDTGARQLELRRLLGRFIDVCNAMEYAHSRGVLHRDLKPGNIMVGKYGETLVVDWGLAKTVGKQEIVSDEPTLRPSSTLSSSGQTLPGSAIGTPAYMSPEQSVGDLDRITRTSDVYSLGATLYHLLCGRPPFEKEELALLLDKVRRGDFPLPRAIAPEIAPPLEAICLKAISVLPANRYPTARALADDLEHWLADEPVTAHADSPSARVARWSRKHRGLVQASSAAVVLLLIVTLTAALLINEQRRQTAKLANEKGTLADTNEQLFKAERAAKTEAQENQKLANERADSLKRALAANYFNYGLVEYEASRLTNGYGGLARAVAMTNTDDPLFGAYRRLLVDRALQGGKLLAPPLWHEASVNSVAFSPDGSRVVTGSKDKTARLWDGRTGRPHGEPMRHEDAVLDVAFSPDGTLVVTGSYDKTARLWDASTGQPLGEPMRHEDMVWDVAFSPDGARVVTGSYDKTARLWDARTGQPLGERMRHEDMVRDVVFSPDGARVVTVSGETARLWDGKTGRPLRELMPPDVRVTNLAFSPDGTRVVTTDSGSAHLWDATTRQPLGEPMQHEGGVNSISFSPDGARIVTGSADQTARLWDGRTGQTLGEPMRHKVIVTRVAFSSDGDKVITLSEDNTARLWDGRTGRSVGEPLRHDQPVNSMAFSPDGARVVTGSSDNTARLWDGRSGRPLGEPMRHLASVHSVAFSSDGARVVTGSEDMTGRLWDGRTGTPIGEPMQHRGSVNSICFSPDGARVVTGSVDKTARLWDGRSGRPLGEPMRHESNVQSVAFSPDGARVVTGSEDKSARLWDGKTGLLLCESMRHEGAVWSVAFSPDGARVVTGSWDCTARLWDGRTGRPLGELMRNKKSVTSVAFSPDGARVVTVSSDNSARLWDGRTGRPLGEPMRHDGFITSVAFSPDGALVVTGSVDNTARLWDATTGRPLGEPLRKVSVTCVAFSPDGARLVVANGVGTARLWDVSSPQFGDVRSNGLITSLELWTGVRSDSDGKIRSLSNRELEQLRDALGADELLGKSQTERYSRGLE